MSIKNVSPGDKVLYCPSGDWEIGRSFEAVVLEILGPESGRREGCIKINLRLKDEDWRMSYHPTRIVRADKVRVR